MKRNIKEGKQGYYTQSHSWFNNKGLQLALYKCIFYLRDKL